MTTSSHLPRSSALPVETLSHSAPPSGLDLVCIQDEAGCCLSFSWRDADRYRVAPQTMLGPLENAALQPVDVPLYLQYLRCALEGLNPVEIDYPFQAPDQHVLLSLTISPLLPVTPQLRRVVVTGSLRRVISEQEAIAILRHLTHPVHRECDRDYQTQLVQAAWDIRRTLDIETVWQKTADGLGTAFDAVRCLIYSYQPGSTSLEAAAEYHDPALTPLRHQSLQLSEEPALQEAIASLSPTLYIHQSSDCSTEGCRAIAIPTVYQEEANGLIVVLRASHAQSLKPQDLTFLEEFVRQIGTGIAHATLFAESRDLAMDLLQANEQLLKKHDELEEAHQQAQKASRLKSEFLANTSHELRTPLNGMIGFLKLVLDGMADGPEEQQEFISEAHRSAVHLLDVINDILDIARIEAGKMQIEMNPVTLDELLTDVENFTRTQAEQKDLRYEILTPATRDRIVLYGNYQRLLQVLLNLVGNAIKFTHDGGITISADVEDGQQDTGHPRMVKLGVADTGIGVSLEDQDKLFQSFSQVDGSRTRRFGGSGLGLVISQKLVEAMGGVVNFFSMGEGLGSTVTFTVPLYQEPVMVDAPE
ncbi:MAG: ATP-binding protein [Cyanobacteria bacterium P01_A01_bin.135]